MNELTGESNWINSTETGDASDHQRFTPAGINAIQGLTRPTENTRPDAKNIHTVVPNDYVSEGKPLDAAAANDLEISAQRAMASKATHYHNEATGSRIAEYRRLRSEITEDLACQNITDGVRADAYSISGTNFPTYDVFGSSEASSVKALTLKNGEPRFGAYRRHFEGLANPGSTANQKAAQELMNLKESDPDRWQELSHHLPGQVAQAATTYQASQALADVSTLRIPHDQVEAVRQDLKMYVAAHPAKFGFSADAYPSDIAADVSNLVERKVLSVDERYDTAHFQGKAVELSQLRDLNFRRLRE